MNVAVIMGRLTADPELRHTSSNIAVTSFTVAVNRAYQSKDSSERQADFINVVAWRNTAEFVCRYFKKGQMIALNGSIQTRTYTDNNGNNRYAFEIVADNVNFTGSKAESGGTQSMGQGGGYSAPQINEPSPAFSNGSSGDFEELIGDDDLPF